MARFTRKTRNESSTTGSSNLGLASSMSPSSTNNALSIGTSQLSSKMQHYRQRFMDMPTSAMNEDHGNLAEGRPDMDVNPQSWVDTASIETMDETKLLDRVKGSAKLTLYATTYAFFVGLSMATLYSPVMNEMNVYLGFNDVQKAFVNSSPNLTGALLRIPAAVALEKYSTKKIHFVLLALSVIGLIPMVFMSIFLYPSDFGPSFLVPMVLFGFIAGGGVATFSAGIATVGFWFPKQDQGTAMGVYGGLGNLSPALWNLLVPLFTRLIGLGGMYMIWVVWLTWSSWICYVHMEDNPYTQLLFTHEEMKEIHPDWRIPRFDKDRAKTLTYSRWSQEKFPQGNAVSALIGAIKIVPVVLLIVTYMVSFGGFLALVAYLPTYWYEAFGLGSVQSGFCTFIYAMITALMRVPGGKMSDYWGGMKVGYVSIIVFLVASILLMISDTFVLSMTAIVLAAIGMGVMNGATFKVVPNICGLYLTGASAWIGSIGASSGFFLPVAMAEIASRYHPSDPMHYQSPFSIFVGANLLSLVLWFLVGVYGRRESERQQLANGVKIAKRLQAASSVGLTRTDGRFVAGTQSEITMSEINTENIENRRP